MKLTDNKCPFHVGLQDSDDEDIEGDIEQQIQTMMAPKRTVKEVTAVSGLANTTGIPSAGAVSAGKLELAKKLASRIQLERNLVTDTKAQLTAEVIMKGGTVNPSQPMFTVSIDSMLCYTSCCKIKEQLIPVTFCLIHRPRMLLNNWQTESISG